MGQPGTITYPNGVTTAMQYAPNNKRLSSIVTNGPYGGLQNLSYSYDYAGNITSVTDGLDASRTQSFQYDSLDRLTQAASPSYGVSNTITYGYDQIGNIINNSQVGAYTYGAQPHAVLQAGGNSYAYDANGNMTGRAGVAITWNYDNKPSMIGSQTYYYDYAGSKEEKVSRGVRKCTNYGREKCTTSEGRSS